MQNKHLNEPILYSVAILSSLSEAGAIMTLLALSSSFLAISQEGFASSAIQSMYYLGIGCIGFFGGAILQRWSSISLGIIGPLISAVIVFFLAILQPISLYVGLTAIFFIFLLNGIQHPNNLRFFNQVLPEQRKLSFFSYKEGVTAVFTIGTPIIASLIIANYGTKICFILDGITYLISCLPWVFLRKKNIHFSADIKEIKWLVGFYEIFKNVHIRSLTVGRLLNNMAYVFCTTAIPLVIAQMAKGDTDFFAFQQGLSNSLLAAGFIVASVVGTRVGKRNNIMISMVYLASILGVGAVLLLMVAIPYPFLLCLSAVILGIGTYCFRISGMTLGQSFTSLAILGPVIIAGDTIVRMGSFLISLVTLWIFECSHSWKLSYTGFLGFSIVIPSFALLAPILIRQLARQFVAKNHSQDANHST